ncbi:polysaccharide lyase family 20 protein [Hypoxylon trugodes]|uniref:polysaccharide lyase family 20 protein n=1 Tax=Hypoxylon trugodes TaxID=326681 RepID=UPI0021913C89|nr:polysaccharide lyase family 20 protein [Hypoxylon trugodes]KAI1393327.1 polysaccharide lyase family 20 protein [Hypoxylon trugodes]
MRLSNTLLALGLTAVEATQFWHNTGTKSGWDAYTHEHKGTVDEVTDQVYKGSTALRMTQIHDSSYSGRYHSEAVKFNAYKKGDTGFYGFAFRLQDNWQFSPAQGYNLAQFITDFSDLNCGEDYMPSTMVWIDGDQLATRVKYGEVCPTDQQKIKSFDGLKKVTAGVWHRVEIQASWKSDNTGFFKLWYDGEKVVEAYNLPTNVGDGRPFQFRVGLYANAWHDHGYEGTQGTRQVWYDQIAAGDAFADAAPDKW